MNSCEKVDFVPVYYEWFPLEYKIPIKENQYYYLEPEYLNMFFRDSRTGFISVQYWFTQSDSNLFLRTNDSCKSFTNLSAKIQGLASRMTFVSDSIMYLLAGGKRPYKSVNGGTDWKELTSPDYHGLSGIFSNPNGNVFLASNEAKILWISEDGGETWKELFNVIDTDQEGDSEFDIKFIGETQDTGFISLMDTLFMSIDGGSSWNYYLYDSVHGFEDYQFLDFNTVYLHHNDHFFKSLDGGRNFDTVCFLWNYLDWKVLSEKESYCSRHLMLSEITTIFKSDNEFQSIAMMDFYHKPDDTSFNYTPEIYVITGPQEGYAICSSGKLFKLDPESD
jgi:hypothetical protein